MDIKQTAADLRNAAMIMEHLNYTTGTFIGRDQARVCLDGAIRLATNEKLGYGIACNPDWCDCPPDGHPRVFWGEALEGEDLWMRHRDAVDAVAALLPDHCTVEKDHPCELAGRTPADLHTDNFVWHYNDLVCTGQQDAIDILIQAAEKLKADL